MTGVAPSHTPLRFRADFDVQARSKSNFRRRAGGSATWDALRAFEQYVSMQVAALVPHGWDIGSPQDRVAARPTVIAVIAARTTIDSSNLSKSVLDALEGVLYVTDAQARSVTTIVEPGRKDPWLSLAFQQMPAGCSVAELAEASADLLIWWERNKPVAHS